MPLSCNIDARGKVARLVYGLIALIIGLALIYFLAWGSGSILRWVVAAGVVGSGAFAIFEGWSGWCVMRAMGFKTSM
ncbi:MAG TPA: hypothetical protein VG326_18415 [Tepidisphaeraceae bacterium]|jgi:hypothetical protein|nr:hypothetical protein [Tepidisphaeraceae bacterium]